MSKIISLKTENVKRISAVEIKPDGKMVVIGGANGQGKSSVLDSIAYALGGKDEIPSVPVRKGEKKASVILELDDVVVKRSFTESGGTTLVVESKDGAKYSSPQSILDKLTGKLTFDPLAFTRLDSKNQAAALKKLIGLDFSELDNKRKKLYDERTIKNRDIASEEAAIKQLQNYNDVPESEIIISEVLHELEKAEEFNKKLEISRFFIVRSSYSFLRLLSRDLHAALARQEKLLNELDEVNKVVSSLRESTKGKDLINTESLRKEVMNAQETNSKILSNKKLKNKQTLFRSLNEESENLTKQIADIDLLKTQQLMAANFPVNGMSFDEDGITLNGIPFDQASSAEQLRTSVAMAAAMNPKLRVMLIRDGSLLDDKSMKLLGDLASEHDLQVWVERVGADEHVSVIIDDGHVQKEIVK